ncbi:MBL fold metallo-hydrolase [Paenibacillus sp. J31TS4]|uniref:MBL fold metallo-hydrolase n=1 Tax=Paenibacillus sp. J31TS4 TaxID=2807195 RepID=UPI001B01005B|nr:MBL fold metallo-hydrolase [Paenibacillus sp. J31TS4]GIP39151.1 MBL fold metallo-hydrolase [Paenibacillus sp. J31TS4]
MTVLRPSGDTLQIKVPLPFPLRWVNSYLVRGRDGYTLIDPGLHTEEAVRLWETVLREEAIGYGDIVSIALTHHHPDHYGLAGWFQERTGAPVWLSAEGQRQAAMLWQDVRPLEQALLSTFLRHGMPVEEREEMLRHMESFLPLVTPQPRLSDYPADGLFRIGDRQCEVLETPGHASGHVCFYDRAAREIYCGDHVLPRISPNVGYLPKVEETPLAQYLASLAQVRTLDVTLAYPGHRDPFAGFAERAEELLRHHDERLAEMRRLLTEPKTCYRLCRDVFGYQLSTHQLRFALAETIAHVIHLRDAGLVAEREQDWLAVYAAC